MAITWEEYEDGATLCLDADLDAAEWNSLSNQYAESFAKILTKMSETVPPSTWNRLLIERWLDAGRLIIYPLKRGKKRASLLLEATLDSSFVQQEYNELPSGEANDITESYLLALDSKISIALRNALNNTEVSKLLELHAEQTDFTIWTCTESDLETLHQIYL